MYRCFYCFLNTLETFFGLVVAFLTGTRSVVVALEVALKVAVAGAKVEVEPRSGPEKIEEEKEEFIGEAKEKPRREAGEEVEARAGKREQKN